MYITETNLCFLLLFEGPDPWENAHGLQLFLDPKTGTGVFVRPRPGRLVLMDQDVSHRVSAPSLLVCAPCWLQSVAQTYLKVLPLRPDLTSPWVLP